MNADVKAKWIEALESGKYRHGRRQLRTTDNAYCCLGVLCDLVAPDKWDGESHDGRVGMPSHGVRDAAGLSIYPQHLDTLTVLNDDKLRSFPEIAQWIRENL